MLPALLGEVAVLGALADHFLHEIAELENSPGSFLEFENRHAEVRTIIWDGEWVISGSDGERRFALDELLVRVRDRAER